MSREEAAKRQANHQIARRMEADRSLYRCTLFAPRVYAARGAADAVALDQQCRERAIAAVLREMQQSASGPASLASL